MSRAHSAAEPGSLRVRRAPDCGTAEDLCGNRKDGTRRGVPHEQLLGPAGEAGIAHDFSAHLLRGVRGIGGGLTVLDGRRAAAHPHRRIRGRSAPQSPLAARIHGRGAALLIAHLRSR
ncbi:hypothetical protein AB0D11_24360 [Streptomyces monashensis]|uniref:hypothetical protein n=1 Tax=Streptomyces monashensis TaxID=1678012 RepID=UPI0033DB3FA6